MKMWVKVAIVGGIWGLVSGILWLLVAAAVMGHHKPFTSTAMEIIFTVLFLPASIVVILIPKIIPQPLDVLPLYLIFLLPIIIGITLALLIYRIRISFRRG